MSKVFLFSLTAALNPSLLAATTIMLLLDRPKRLLLGYWLGAMTTGITLGIVIIEWLKGSNVVQSSKHSVDPALNIALGVLLVLIAVVVATGRPQERMRSRERKAEKGPKKQPRWQRTLSQGSPRATFVVGILLSFPGASYIAALTEISRQKLGTAEMVLTVLAVNLIMLILLELPLIGYALAPDRTPAAVEGFKDWASRNGRRIVVVGASVVGAALIARGVINF
jgi:Sap, sulfolipid-1-addressing protein